MCSHAKNGRRQAMDVQEHDGVLGLQSSQDAPVDPDRLAGLLFKRQLGGMVRLVLVDPNFDHGSGFKDRLLDPEQGVRFPATRLRQSAKQQLRLVDVGLGGLAGKLAHVEDNSAPLPKQSCPDIVPDKHAGILGPFSFKIAIVEKGGTRKRNGRHIVELMF